MLRLQWPIIVVFTAAVMVIALGVSLLTQKLYRSSAVIEISPRAGQELHVDEVVDYDGLSQERTYAKTQIDLLQSRDLREEVLRRYEALGYGDMTVVGGGVAHLGRMLGVAQRKDSELVDISITDSDPERAARLANLITEVYRDQNLDGRRDSARDAKEWLQQQLVDYKQRIIDQSSALIAYQSRHDLADAEQDVTRQSATTDALVVAYGDVNTQRVLLETTVRSHERLLAADAYEALAKDMDTPLVVALTQQYSAAATENAQLKARYLERWPERAYSDARLAGIASELRKEVERTLATEKAQLDMLRSKEQSLSQEIDLAKAQLLERQALYVEYQRLKLDLDRAKEFYSTLSQRDGELDLVSRTHLSNVRVVDAARADPRPVSPDIPSNMLIAMVLGLVIGSAIAFLVEYLDDTISTPFDVTTYLRVPFLGIVPRLEEAEDDRDRALYTLRHRSSPAAEAVRTIRTVMELNPNAKALHRLLVTSSYKSEGKTNTVVSLAVAFASMGRRVLVVDADLRRPRVAYIFEVPEGAGLSTVLMGGPVDAAIVASGVPNLHLLPAGPSAEGPNELLTSAAMAELLDLLDPRYDVILIDSPPSGILSDAAILSKLVDGVVFVVREKTVSRWLVRDVVYGLNQVGAPLLGVVVNNVDLVGRNSKYKYYYSRRYHPDEKPDVAAK